MVIKDMGSYDLEDDAIKCPECGNNDLANIYVEPLGFQCEKCGYDSRDIIRKHKQR